MSKQVIYPAFGEGAVPTERDGVVARLEAWVTDLDAFRAYVAAQIKRGAAPCDGGAHPNQTECPTCCNIFDDGKPGAKCPRCWDGCGGIQELRYPVGEHDWDVVACCRCGGYAARPWERPGEHEARIPESFIRAIIHHMGSKPENEA